MEPKIWSKHEIIDLIEAEIKACRASQNPEDRKASNMAETIYGVLNNENLIQHDP